MLFGSSSTLIVFCLVHFGFEFEVCFWELDSFNGSALPISHQNSLYWFRWSRHHRSKAMLVLEKMTRAFSSDASIIFVDVQNRHTKVFTNCPSQKYNQGVVLKCIKHLIYDHQASASARRSASCGETDPRKQRAKPRVDHCRFRNSEDDSNTDHTPVTNEGQ